MRKVFEDEVELGTVAIENIFIYVLAHMVNIA